MRLIRYRPSSVVCLSVYRSVCHSSEPAKTAEPIEMPFELRTQLGRRNRVLDRVQLAPCKGKIFRGKNTPGHARRHSAVSHAKTAEPIVMPFGLLIRVGPMKQVLGGVHTDTTWRNTTEPFMCGSNATFLSNYFNQLLSRVVFVGGCQGFSLSLVSLFHPTE